MAGSAGAVSAGKAGGSSFTVARSSGTGARTSVPGPKASVVGRGPEGGGVQISNPTFSGKTLAKLENLRASSVAQENRARLGNSSPVNKSGFPDGPRMVSSLDTALKGFSPLS